MSLTKAKCGLIYFVFLRSKILCLFVYNMMITSLNILRCTDNQLTALDVSENTALTKLDCCFNKLTALDVSKNTALISLSCVRNQLTSLDLSNTNIMNDPNCGNSIYQIVVDNDPTFDLSILPGNFVVAKASDWSGGTVSGNMLTVDSGKDTVTYKYDCGKGKNVTFTLKFVGLFADYTKVDEAIAKANVLKKEKPASTKLGTSDKGPQTGDTSNLALWIALLFVSGDAAISTTVVSRKKKYNR